MKLKLDEDGHAVLKDGHPVYEYSDGTEDAFDASAVIAKKDERIENLEQEKTRHFDAAKKAKEDLKAFEGIDADKYKDAMKKFKALEDQTLVDEQGVEALKKQINQIRDEGEEALKTAHKKTVDEKDQENMDLKQIIYDLAIKNKFATDPHFSGQNPITIYPADDAAMIFGKNFEVEIKGTDYKIIAKDDENKPILSKKTTEPANFSEAIAHLVQTRAKTNAILRNSKTGGPVALGNFDNKNTDGSDKRSVDKIRSGLQKHYQL